MPINSPCRFDQQHNMTGSKKEFSIVALTLLALGALACALAWPGYSQGVAQTSKSQTAIAAPDSSLVKKTIQPLAAMTSEPVWAASARQNSLLRDQLTWVFGGREQRGWALYTPLIARTLDTNAPADTSDFAQALAGDHVEIARAGEAPNNVGAAGRDEVLVSLRRDAQHDNAFWLWAAADNLRIETLTAVEAAKQALELRKA